jgi:hypothetical protein
MLGRVLHFLRNLRDLAVEDYLAKNLRNHPKYQDPLRLAHHEFKGFSQHGEDGIIEEIFNRIGSTNREFVEFGAGNGLENNSALLLVKGWSGLWMEGGKKNAGTIRSKFADLIRDKRLRLLDEYINAENIEELFRKGGVPAEFDFLSIDLDGNDYWIWKSINAYKPRVVCMEYNGVIPPSTRWIMKYNPAHIWSGSVYMSSSLKSLELLGAKKGYKLVGCDFSGVNAFFVREDLVGDRFLAPFTAENHFEPNRGWLTRTHRHHPDFGPFAID